MVGYWQTGNNLRPSNGSSSINAVSGAVTQNGVGTDVGMTKIGDRGIFATISNTSGTTVGVGFASTAIRDISLKYDAAGGSRLYGNLVTQDAVLSSNRATGVAIAQKLGDVTVRAGLSQNNTQLDSNPEVKTRSGWLAGLEYGKGPFEAAYARQEIKSTSVVSAGTSLESNAKQTVDIAGASYDFGKVKLFTSYANIKVDDATITNGGGTTITSLTAQGLFTGEGKRTYYTLGAAAPVGKAVLFATASQGTINQNTDSATAPGGSTANGLTATTGVKRDMSGYTIGARYNLSKRTFGYAAVGQAKIDATSGTANYYKVEQVTAGVAHSF